MVARHEPPLKEGIQKLYKRGVLEISIFTWVSAVKHTLPGTSVDQALNGFYKCYDITEEDLPRGTAATIYYRTLKEVFNVQKTTNTG